MRRALRTTTILLPLLAVAALVGCGGGDGEDREVASLATTADDAPSDTNDATGSTGTTDDSTDSTDSTGSTGSTDSTGDGGSGPRAPGMVVMQNRGGSDDPELQDAQVRYSRCMRDHGVDMPDPGTGDGPTRIEIDDPDAWQEAEEACRPILEEIVGTFEPPSEEEQARMREELLEFTKCMREHGIDMPDPQFDDEGGVTINAGVDGGPAGPAPDDDFEQAAEECGGPGGGMVFSSAEAESD